MEDWTGLVVSILWGLVVLVSVSLLVAAGTVVIVIRDLRGDVAHQTPPPRPPGGEAAGGHPGRPVPAAAVAAWRLRRRSVKPSMTTTTTGSRASSA